MPTGICSLYRWCVSGFVEGLEGMDGRGDPMEDLGDLGGALKLPQVAWAPPGGKVKLPCSEEEEDERDRWGEASTRHMVVGAKCTGEVTGGEDTDVGAAC